MTYDEMIECFDKHEDKEHLQFERVYKPRHKLRDLNGLLLISALTSQRRTVLGAACHDEVYVHCDLKKLAVIITEDDVIEILRSGFLLDESCGGFRINV